MTVVAPYGSWRSPIKPSMLVSDAVRLGSAHVDGDDVYWIERRPSEGGRQALARLGHGDVLASDANVRTLVHEYGGRSYDVRDGVVVWSSFADQRLYLGDAPVTPDPPSPRSVRFADHEITADGRWVLCVRERHIGGGEVVNDVVAVPLDGTGDAVVLAAGHDFFAAPRLSRDGTRVCWLSWDFPNMPWDGTELWVADVDVAAMVVTGARLVAGGPAESITEPAWSPAGELHWVSDRTGWWNLYGERAGHLVARDAEFAGPQWVFGNSHYAFLPEGAVVASWTAEGADHIGMVRSDGGGIVEELDVPYSVIGSLAAAGPTSVVAIAGSANRPTAVVRIDVDTGDVEVLREAQQVAFDRAYLSVPRAITFPTTGDREAHALHYAPANPEFEGPDGEAPPLIVLSHGGPTSRATPDLDLGISFFTSRGFAVVDVNYGGSTGYGRPYRERLNGTWGITDVDDCVAAARWLAEQGMADAARLVIRGGSAGGYTTLAALTFQPDVFACGASHYGVADVEALARDTHKFESRYLDNLIGPYPEAAALYKERSPINATERLSCPLILFQGLEDEVVPPEQSQMMAEALAAKGIPHAYLAFEGEQHGFRRAETVIAVAEAELSFFGKVLGFSPADELPPVRIEHESALATWGRGSQR